MTQDTEYTPTHRRVCTLSNCKGYNKPLVDRGYGYPVCETCGWVDVSERIAMNKKYLEILFEA